MHLPSGAKGAHNLPSAKKGPTEMACGDGLACQCSSEEQLAGLCADGRPSRPSTHARFTCLLEQLLLLTHSRGSPRVASRVLVTLESLTVRRVRLATASPRLSDGLPSTLPCRWDHSLRHSLRGRDKGESGQPLCNLAPILRPRSSRVPACPRWSVQKGIQRSLEIGLLRAVSAMSDFVWKTGDTRRLGHGPAHLSMA